MNTDQKLCMGCMEYVKDNANFCPLCGYDQNSQPTVPHQLAPGTLLNNKYLVGRVLGEGGFGITYVGRDKILDMKIAIKEFYMSGYVNRNITFSPDIICSVGENSQIFEKNRERFLDEARILAKFSSEPGIVGIRDFFLENNTAYIIMDYLEGQTLNAYLDKCETISYEKTLELLMPVMKSLQNVHDHGVIHRDISPDNIMLTNSGKVKLLDFGAARQLSQTDIKSMSVILKPGYAPEEQYRSKGHQGPWTDVYALSATMYRCITGKTPDDSMERMFQDHLPSPNQLNPACPIAISNVIMKGMAVRQTDRYQSVYSLCEGIEYALKNPNHFVLPTNDHTVYAQDVIDTPPPVIKTVQPVYKTAEPKPVTVQPPITQTQQPKKKNKALPFIIIGSALLVFAILILVGLYFIGKSSSSSSSNAKSEDNAELPKSVEKFVGGGTTWDESAIPSSLQDYNFLLNGTKFTLPISYDYFKENDWVLEDEDQLTSKVLRANEMSTSHRLANRNGEIKVSFYNPTDSSLPLSDCMIYQITVEDDQLNYDYPDKQQNLFYTEEYIGFKSTLKDVANTYGEDYFENISFLYSNNFIVEYMYGTRQESGYFEAHFSTDAEDGHVSKIEFTNKVFEDEVVSESNETTSETPLVRNAKFVVDGKDYYLPCTLQNMLDLGWKITENYGEYLDSQSEIDITLQSATQPNFILTVSNPTDSSILLEDARVDYLCVVPYTDTDENELYAEEFEFHFADVVITYDTTRDEIKQMIRDHNWYSEDTSEGFTYDDGTYAEIVYDIVYPYNDDRGFIIYYIDDLTNDPTVFMAAYYSGVPAESI